ncbi:MAG: GspE/PulE family protein [bacterium]|nr:GspE/PulE family protein [bacterium]
MKIEKKINSPVKNVLQKMRGKKEGGKNLLDFLEEDQLIDAEKYKLIKQEAQKTDLPLEQIIRNLDLVPEKEFVQALGKFLEVEFVDLESRPIAPQVLKLIPQEVAISYRMIAFERTDNNAVKVAMADPADFKALEALEFAMSRQNVATEVYITNKASLNFALRQYEKSLKEEVTRALEEVVEKKVEEKKTLAEREKEIVKFVEAAPISKIVQGIIKHAVEAGASDIHIEPEDQAVKVRYRVDGVMRPALTLPGKIRESVVSRVKVLANLKIDETRIPQDGRIRLEFAGRPVDFRISTLPTVNGEKIVMRILESGTKIYSLEELGLSGLRLNQVKAEIAKSHGLLLVTGPTGSGKSTTLYSILGILNQEDVNIVTLEDPVEYFMPGIAQAQVHPEVGLTFASGLRSILRQDPDVIMVGEIRDQETAEMAIHASLTGHVVLSTLHTNSAIGAVPRLIDMGIQPFLITAAVNIIIAQRLVRKICEECKETFPAPPEIAKMIFTEWEKIPALEKEGMQFDQNKATLYKGKGCKHCGNEGYRGRIGIFEAIPLTPDFQSLVLARPSENQIEELAIKKGLINMKQDGILKVLRGETTLEEVLKATNV